jgi:multicomponent Na+:H+ antiporter subunit F
MTSFLYGIAALLVLNLGVGLVRVARGPTPGDRMVAAQLFGTHGVATLLVLAAAEDAPVLRDVALVFALLAVVVSVTFVKRGWVRQTQGAVNEGEDGGGSPSLEP